MRTTPLLPLSITYRPEVEFLLYSPELHPTFVFKTRNAYVQTGKAAVLVGLLSTLTACTGHVQNTKNNCSYDYLLHPAISISKIIGGCGPAADQ